MEWDSWALLRGCAKAAFWCFFIGVVIDLAVASVGVLRCALYADIAARQSLFQHAASPGTYNTPACLLRVVQQPVQSEGAHLEVHPSKQSMIAAFHPCVPCCAVLCRGVLNIVHGTHDTVNRILDHPDIAAVSFVGGDKAGRYIYERAAANGKRVQVSTCACGMARACNRPCVLSSRLLVLQHTIHRAGIQVATQRGDLVDGVGMCSCLGCDIEPLWSSTRAVLTPIGFREFLKAWTSNIVTQQVVAHMVVELCDPSLPMLQCNLGAKNHAVVMPDADLDATVKALTGAGFGAAGQRCMAVSAVVFVGGLERWREPLLEAARSLKVHRACTLTYGAHSQKGIRHCGISSTHSVIPCT